MSRDVTAAKRQSEKNKDAMASGLSPWAEPKDQPYRTKLEAFDGHWRDTPGEYQRRACRNDMGRV